MEFAPSIQAFALIAVADGVAEFGQKERSSLMLSWSITFLIIAIIAAVLGFEGIAGAAAGIAKVLFGLFLVLFLLSLFFGRKAV